MMNINEGLNELEKELSPLVEYAKWELYNFSQIKKSKKIIKKELILIDKGLLKQWKEKSGYNMFKKQIFNYISYQNKIKNDKEKINEANIKLNSLWQKALSDKKIDLSNLKTLPKRDITDFFVNIKEQKINGYKNYDIISEKLYKIFQNFINCKIKIDGFYNNGKLIIPLNYKRQKTGKNGDYFLEIIYINNKNECEDFLYVLPNDINICNKLEKEVLNNDIEQLIKNIFSNINDQENLKEFNYIDEQGSMNKYKVLNKKLLLNQKNKKENINKQKILKPNNSNAISNQLLLKRNSNNNNIINDEKKNESDIDKLRQELLNKINILHNLDLKVKERNNNLIKMKKNLEEEKNKFNQEKNIFYNEHKNKGNNNNNQSNNNILIDQKMIENLKNKCLMNEKEYEIKQQELSKMQNVLSDKKKFLESYQIKNNNNLKLKENEYNKKTEIFNNNEEEFEKKKLKNSSDQYLFIEDNLNDREELLNKKEDELNIREKQLIEREQKINEEKIKNNEIDKKLDEQINDLNDKLIYMKNKEYLMNIKKEKDEKDQNDDNFDDEDEKELAKIQEELEEEMNLENNKNEESPINKDNINKNYNNNDESSHVKKIQPKTQNILLNSFEKNNINKFISLSPSNSNKYNKGNKNTDKKNTINISPNNKESTNYKKYNTNDNRKSLNLNYLRSKTISMNESLNNNIRNNSINNIYNKNLSLNPSVLQTQTKIDRLLPSLGLERAGGPINLNAIVQCFAHIPEFSEGLLELGYNKFFKERKNIVLLSRNFATIVNNIFFPQKFNNNTRKFSPKAFVDTFLNMYPLNNPQAYLSTVKILKFILETLHDELNIKKNDKKNEEKENNDEIDNTNQKDVLVKFLTKLTENNNSLISKLFYGLTKLRCVCNDCGNISYAFDFYDYLFFDLIKIKHYHKNNKFGNNKSIFLSLNDCLDYYTRAINLSTSLKEIDKNYLEKLKINQKNGKFFCKKCKTEKNCTFYKSIYSAHTILPIILERGNDNNYNIDELKFPDELNLENYVEFNKSIKKYYLCGVVSNNGDNNTYGKFCAYCRMVPNGKWYCYKNEYVSNCTIKDVHQNGVPCLLFYHKV